ncbi:hypothetical protein NL108_013609, partial [Boleophthalmus pectinirostris]
SPEAFVGAPYHHALDVWSLGCIALEMLLGTTLFPGWHDTDTVSLCSRPGS